MKKLLLAIVSLSVALAAQSEEPAARKHVTKEEARKIIAERQMQRTGGIVRKEGSAAGCVVFINAQKTVKNAELKPAWGSIGKSIKLNIAAKDVDSVNVRNPAADIAKAGGKVGVVVVEEADLPALLTAPEEGWAIVNVAALNADKPDAANLSSRVRKEILRGFGLVSGAAFMSMSPVVLRWDVVGPRDLDKIKPERLGEEAVAACEKGLSFHGVTPWIETTYLRACEQGWAPAPTNDAQKAIWDKIHAAPTKPLKITYDKDKQKPVVK